MVNRRRASVRDMLLPAPWLQLMKLFGLPRPRTIYDRAAWAHGALSRDEHLLAEVSLMRDVVMMAVHDLVGGRERRNSPRRTSRLENRVHHQLAVEARVALRPTYSVDVFVEVLCPFFEIGEIAVGQIADEMAHVLF